MAAERKLGELVANLLERMLGPGQHPWQVRMMIREILWPTAGFVAGLNDTASGVVGAASRGVSPVGATPLPPTHWADCLPTLS